MKGRLRSDFKVGHELTAADMNDILSRLNRLESGGQGSNTSYVENGIQRNVAGKFPQKFRLYMMNEEIGPKDTSSPGDFQDRDGYMVYLDSSIGEWVSNGELLEDAIHSPWAKGVYDANTFYVMMYHEQSGKWIPVTYPPPRWVRTYDDGAYPTVATNPTTYPCNFVNTDFTEVTGTHNHGATNKTSPTGVPHVWVHNLFSYQKGGGGSWIPPNTLVSAFYLFGKWYTHYVGYGRLFGKTNGVINANGSGAVTVWRKTAGVWAATSVTLTVHNPWSSSIGAGKFCYYIWDVDAQDWEIIQADC